MAVKLPRYSTMSENAATPFSVQQYDVDHGGGGSGDGDGGDGDGDNEPGAKGGDDGRVGENGGRAGGDGLGGGKERTPQSAQSDPYSQKLYSAPDPPSSQSPSFVYEQEVEQTCEYSTDW